MDAPASGAQPKSFSSLPDNLGFLQNSVNLFSGQVQFGIPITSIAGKSGLGYNLTFSYSSKVKFLAETWNREAPTGVLGLGWSIDLPRIVADNKGTGTREDDTFYLVEGGSSNELFYDGLDGTEWKYYLKSYQFWKLRYNPTAEVWTIIKDDGTKYIYGDVNSQRKTVQYIIKWGNWIGNSSLGAGQQQVNSWFLSEIIDLWNDKLTFEYQDDYQFIGGLIQTVALYLKEVKNTIGEKITLIYLSKLNNQLIPGTSVYAKEYVDPHSYIGAHQDNFESKYLDRITKYDQNNLVMEDIKTGYDFMGADELAKRLLNSITRFSQTGEALPSLVFNYEKNNSAGNNFGALKQIVAPTKGTVEFAYEEKILTDTKRDYLVQAVSVQPTGTYYEPRFWIGDDFVVISRRLRPGLDQPSTPHVTSPQPVILDVFTWDGGKWIQKNLGNYTTTGTLVDVTVEETSYGSDFKEQDFQLVMGKDFFAVLNQRGESSQFDLRLFKRNENIPGEWYDHYEQISGVYIPTLLAGEEFVLIGGKQDRFYVYEWNGTSWLSWYQNIDDDDHFYAAGHNYFIMHNENNTQTDEIDFYFKNKTGQWQTSSVPSAKTFNSEYRGSSYWYAANSFAVVMANDNNEFIYTWDENFSNFQKFNTGIGVPDNSPVSISGSMVLLTRPSYFAQDGTEQSDKGYAFRFDGQTWKASGQLNYYGQNAGIRNLFSLGEDFIYRPYTVTSPSVVYKSFIRRFDANTRSWRADVEFGRSNNNYSSIAGYNFFMCNGQLYFRNPNETFSAPVATNLSWDVSSNLNTSQPVSAGFDFVAYSTSTTSTMGVFRAILMKNGQKFAELERPASMEGMSETDSQIIYDIVHSVSGFVLVPSAQVGGSTIITCLAQASSTVQQDSKVFKLYRKVGNQIDGPLSDFVVTLVTTNDGVSQKYTSYDYDVSSATADVGGFNFQFNKVTTIPGSSNPAARPNGYSVSFFMNGKTSAQVVGSDPEAAYPSVNGNMASFLKKLTGLHYKSLNYSDAGNIVSKSATDYNHYYHNQYSDQAGFYLRPSFNLAEGDGLKTQTAYYYDIGTKQLESENIVTLSTSGSPVQTIANEYVYWWEGYDFSPPRTKNILSPLIYKRRTVDGVVTEISYTRWKNWGPNNTPAPFDSYTWIGPSLSAFSWDTNTTPSADWYFTGKVNTRDLTTGAPLEEIGNADQLNCIILDQDKRFPLAKIVNASFNDVAYCGFEDSSTGNLSWADGIITTGDSKTGNKYFSLGTTGLTKSGLSSSTSYKISFWVKTSGGSVAIDGVSAVVNLGTLTSWTLFEYTVTNLSSINIRKSGATEVVVDDVRIHPVNARMTTSTFHPILGVTSETGSNNRTIYYEYDGFGRPKFVRDEDKNIVKHVFSNFKN